MMKLLKAIVLPLVSAVFLIGAASAQASTTIEESLVGWHAAGQIDFSSGNTVYLPENASFTGMYTLTLEALIEGEWYGKGTLKGITAIPEFTYPVKAFGSTYHPKFQFIQLGLSKGELSFEHSGETRGDIHLTLPNSYLLSIPESSLGIETTKDCNTTLTQSLSASETLEEFAKGFGLTGLTKVAGWKCEGNSELAANLNSILGGAKNSTAVFLTP